MPQKPSVLVTGVSGSLGLRLLEQLQDYHVIGVGPHEPSHRNLAAFQKLDLAEERSCDDLLAIFRQHRPQTLVHLASTGHSPRANTPDRERMWMINVAGTGRVMEAIAEHNRSLGTVEKFVYISSAEAYGPDLPKPAMEASAVEGGALPWIADKRETDLAIQTRIKSLRQCRVYLLRPQPYAGKTAHNFVLSALHGLPEGSGHLASRMRRKEGRLPLLLPSGGTYLDRKRQFVHLDDMARLIAEILRRSITDPHLTVMNVAGRGDPVLLRTCIEIAKAEVKRLPGKTFCRQAVQLLWDLGISGLPPDALPWLLGSQLTDSSRLRVFLGDNYRNVIQYTSAEALIESFKGQP
ncbi:MAG TPA: NAD-dependent epimerase/dehydratase family protein [Candidatus Angelobacter sp.]|nr:NAD-dependent epimerase/dehydratase family protein [Candidatus Angelobacter sp.]